MRRIFTFLVISGMMITFSCQKQSKDKADTDLSGSQVKSAQENYSGLIAKQKSVSEAKIASVNAKTADLNTVARKMSSLSAVSAKKMLINVPGDYTTIQAAVDNSADGALINVSGNYTESVYIIGKSHLTINGGGTTTLENTVFSFAIGYSRNITIKGFTITNGIVYCQDSPVFEFKDNDVSGPGDGINLIRSDSSAIKNNSIHNNTPGYGSTGDGIWLYQTKHNTIANNHLFENSDNGIDLYGASENMIQGNIAENNVTAGIQLRIDNFDTFEGSNFNTLQNNECNSNTFGIWVIYNSTDNVIKVNTAHNNAYGMVLDGAAFGPVTGTQVAGCDISNNYDYGMFIYYGANENTFLNTTVNSCGSLGILLLPTTEKNTFKDCTSLYNGTCDYVDDGNNISINNNFGCSSN